MSTEPRENTENLIVISGCSGGGKSTLLAELAARGYHVCEEPGRQVVREQLRVGGDGLPWANSFKFAELCISRAMYFHSQAAQRNAPTFFDRSLIDNIAGFVRLQLPMPAYFTAALQHFRYARRVFMTPPWVEIFAQDEERRHSFADAEAEFAGLQTVYPANGYDIVMIPKLSVQQRATFVIEHRLDSRRHRLRDRRRCLRLSDVCVRP